MSDQQRAKRVVLGVSGSIAAYKAADLASQLVKAGIDVWPVLTADGARFVQPATFRALTGHACSVDVFDEPIPGEIGHIWLAQNCDLIVIAPASMTVMAKLAHGMADDMLTATVMASAAPILYAPGMNTLMWSHPATQRNLAQLSEMGAFFVDPVSGRLACRTEGVGKMAEVKVISEAIQELLTRGHQWKGRKVLVTAGPTREPLDPVRYLSNRSSGKMGYAVAEAARIRGASVTLISGPTALNPPGGVEFVPVVTASEMCEEAMARFQSADLVVAAAAVADYRPSIKSHEKIKKSGASGVIELQENQDIVSAMAAGRRPDQILVGFSAETENLLINARNKRISKGLDWIVANDVTQKGAGFDIDTNIVTLIGPKEQEIALPLLTKRDTADRILDIVWPE